MEAPAPKSSSRYLIALVLLVLVIGGLAWLTQQLPNWRSATSPDGADREVPKVKGPDVCRFFATSAVWHPEWPAYFREFEKGELGHYDFPFENPSDLPGEIGLIQVDCTCSGVLASLTTEEAWADWTAGRAKDPALDVPEHAVTPWVRLVREADAGKSQSGPYPAKTFLSMPPRSKGVLRVTWDSKGNLGEFKRLLPVIWAQPAGESRQRLVLEFSVIFRITSPVQFYPRRVKLEEIGGGDKAMAEEIFVWSSTRANPKVEFRDERPLFHVEARPLDVKEIEDLRGMILRNEKYTSGIRVAWALKPTVFAGKEVEGKQFLHDLGPFVHPIGITVDDESLDDVPQVAGAIRGAIVVGEEKDRGKIDLGIFDPGTSTRRKIPLQSDGTVRLQYERHEPRELLVKLNHLPKRSTASRNAWELDVEVPPDSLFGPFPERSAVYLRILGDPPRLIRVPVIGTAKSAGR